MADSSDYDKLTEALEAALSRWIGYPVDPEDITEFTEYLAKSGYAVVKVGDVPPWMEPVAVFMDASQVHKIYRLRGEAP